MENINVCCGHEYEVSCKVIWWTLLEDDVVQTIRAKNKKHERYDQILVIDVWSLYTTKTVNGNYSLKFPQKLT